MRREERRRPGRLSRPRAAATIGSARSDPEGRGDSVDKKAKTPKKQKQAKTKTAK
jgi:hypothetical protein